jgi:hypothetical protein
MKEEFSSLDPSHAVDEVMYMNPTRFIWKQDQHSPNPVAEDLTAIDPLLGGYCTVPQERLEARTNVGTTVDRAPLQKPKFASSVRIA